MAKEKIYTGKIEVLNSIYGGLLFKIESHIKKNIFIKNDKNLSIEDKNKIVKFILTTEYAGYDANGHNYIDYGTIINDVVYKSNV